ncbi:hypothetical protein PMI17_04687 [Pantoea sp. GM01]|nr:hypothetical protein PMI17_04687 [Pantoea sp. GM01]
MLQSGWFFKAGYPTLFWCRILLQSDFHFASDLQIESYDGDKKGAHKCAPYVIGYAGFVGSPFMATRI